MKYPIDRNSALPYYAQVKELLREWIKQGKWSPGEQLPGELELCSIFDVSRPVIRQALTELVYDGLIAREKGKGTFVAGPKIKEGLVQRLTGFYQDMTAQGYTPVTQVLAQEVVEASPDLAKRLNVKPETPLIKVERLRFIEGDPIVLVTTFVPLALCPQLLHEDLSNQSLYAFLEQHCHITITNGHRIVEAVPASKYAAKLLKIRKGSPLIKLQSVSYTANGTPVEYYDAFHRGDRSQFEVELVRVADETEVRDMLSESSPMVVKFPKRPGA